MVAIKISEVNLLTVLNKLPSTVNRFNKLFIADITKEIKWYRQAKVWKT
mgnify:FL=1